MYCEEILKISKAETGFILEACAPIKEKKSANSGLSCCGPSEGTVRFIAKDESELFAKITEILPKLDVSYSSAEAFDKAFKAATMEEGD
jgi:hypothetical protein